MNTETSSSPLHLLRVDVLCMKRDPTAADLQAAVRAEISEQSASGETVTARTVRLAVEKRLGLAVDSLLPRKDELMGFIAEELQQATSTHAAGAV